MPVGTRGIRFSCIPRRCPPFPGSLAGNEVTVFWHTRMADAGLSKPGRSLAARTASGFGWVVAWRALSRVMGIGSTLILVRLLLPSDFGLIALAMSITQAVELLSALGVQDAVVRYQNPSPDIYNTAFTMGVLRAIANAVMIAMVAWPMAAFFDDMRLVPIVLAIALGILITGCENIGVVEFRRDLAYNREMWLRLFPRVLGVVVTIAMAVIWRSYWALVVGGLVNRLAGTAMTYTFHPHRPRLTLVMWRELAGFSIWVWVSALVGMARDRVEVFAIGRMLGTAAVGAFSVTVEIAILPMSELIQPLAQVLFSSFSRAAWDDVESRDLFLRFLGLSALCTIPIGVGIALLADPLTHVLLGPNWISAIPVLQVTAAFNGLMTFGFLSRAVLEARTQMSVIFTANAVVGVVRLVAAIVLVAWLGLLGAAIGAIIGCAVDQFILFRATCRTLSLPWFSIGERLWRPLLGSLTMAAAIVATGFHLMIPGAGPVLQVLVMLATATGGAAIFVVTVLLAWLLCGRPLGAEADMLRAARESLARLRRWPGHYPAASLLRGEKGPKGST